MAGRWFVLPDCAALHPGYVLVDPPAHEISRVMRFAQVKAESAQRTGDTQQSASPG